MDMMEVDSNAGSSVGNSSKGVSFEELAQIYDNAKKQANFFVSISELLDCTTNETQRNRIRQAKWDPLTIRGTEYCAAFIKTVFPICTNSSKVATIFEASAISETGLIRKVIYLYKKNLISTVLPLICNSFFFLNFPLFSCR